MIAAAGNTFPAALSLHSDLGQQSFLLFFNISKLLLELCVFIQVLNQNQKSSFLFS